MNTTPPFEIPTDVRKMTEKSVEQVKTAISGYLQLLQRAIPGDVMGGSELRARGEIIESELSVRGFPR